MRIREATIGDMDALASLASRTFIDPYDDLSEEAFDRYVSEFFSSGRIRGYKGFGHFGAAPYTDGGMDDRVLIMACRTKTKNATGQRR